MLSKYLYIREECTKCGGQGHIFGKDRYFIDGKEASSSKQCECVKKMALYHRYDEANIPREYFDLSLEGFKETYGEMLDGKKRATIPFLTKYEKARIIGMRATQIAKGSPALVDVGDLEDPIDIALKELMERKIPYIIRRPLPNGTYEDWRVDELRILND